MKITTRARLVGGLAAGSLLLAACGDDGGTTAEPDPVQEPAGGSDESPGEATTADVLAAIASSGLGDILVDADGLSLYGFTNDVDGVPACYDACADAWPPIIVEGDVTLGDGLDAATFSTVERTDGTTQLVAGDWPLYLFAGDGAPGDINGQGSGDVWFLAAPDGSLIKGDDAGGDAGGEETPEEPPATDGAAPIVTTADTDAGTILVDADGLSLYGFTNDVDGAPACHDACADAWPPVIVEGMALPDGLDPAVFSIADRGDGTYQLRAGDWPLYLFAGDGAPGDTNGQGSGDVWFLAAPDGSLIKGDADVSDEAASGYSY